MATENIRQVHERKSDDEFWFTTTATVDLKSNMLQRLSDTLAAEFIRGCQCAEIVATNPRSVAVRPACQRPAQLTQVGSSCAPKAVGATNAGGDRRALGTWDIVQRAANCLSRFRAQKNRPIPEESACLREC